MKTASAQGGAALIVALVIVAIATILSTTLVWQNHLELRRTANQLFGSEAQANLLGMEDFARFLFAEDNPDFDHFQEAWAEQGVVFPIEGGLLTGDIVDLQARYNINNLVNWEAGGIANETEVDRFRRLLATLGLDERLAASIVDWIDRDIEPTGFDGAEDDYYSRFVPAYRTPNRPLWHVSELRQVAHMTPEQFVVLEPYLVALPPGKGAQITRVNINTAPPELLVALDEELDPAVAAQIVELRAQAGFETLEALDDDLDYTPADVFSVNSNWFRLRGRAEIGSSRLTMYSVLHRDTQAGTVRILYRSFGTP